MLTCSVSSIQKFKSDLIISRGSTILGKSCDNYNSGRKADCHAVSISVNHLCRRARTSLYDGTTVLQYTNRGISSASIPSFSPGDGEHNAFKSSGGIDSSICNDGVYRGDDGKNVVDISFNRQEVDGNNFIARTATDSSVSSVDTTATTKQLTNEDTLTLADAPICTPIKEPLAHKCEHISTHSSTPTTPTSFPATQLSEITSTGEPLMNSSMKYSFDQLSNDIKKTINQHKNSVTSRTDKHASSKVLSGISALLIRCVVGSRGTRLPYTKQKEHILNSTQKDASFNTDLSNYSTIAWELAEWGVSKGYVPTQSDYAMLGSLSVRFGNVKGADQCMEGLLQIMPKAAQPITACNVIIAQLVKDRTSVTTLLDYLNACGAEPNTDTFNHILQGMINPPDARSACVVLSYMKQSGCPRNENTYSHLMAAYAQENDRIGAYSALKDMVSDGILPVGGTWNVLLSAFVKHNNVAGAQELIPIMNALNVEDNTRSHQLLLQLYSQNGLHTRSLGIAHRMLAKNMKFIDGTLENLVHTIYSNDLKESGAALIRHARSKGHMINAENILRDQYTAVPSYSSSPDQHLHVVTTQQTDQTNSSPLLSQHVHDAVHPSMTRTDEMATLSEVIAEAPTTNIASATGMSADIELSPSVDSNNAILRRLRQEKQRLVATDLFNRMRSIPYAGRMGGGRPDVVSYRIMMGLYTRTGWANHALALWEELRGIQRLLPDRPTYNSALAAMRRLPMCTGIQSVETLFREMQAKEDVGVDTTSFNMLLQCYLASDQPRKAVDVVINVMARADDPIVRPDEHTFWFMSSSLISAQKFRVLNNFLDRSVSAGLGIEPWIQALNASSHAGRTDVFINIWEKCFKLNAEGKLSDVEYRLHCAVAEGLAGLKMYDECLVVLSTLPNVSRALVVAVVKRLTNNNAGANVLKSVRAFLPKTEDRNLTLRDRVSSATLDTSMSNDSNKDRSQLSSETLCVSESMITQPTKTPLSIRSIQHTLRTASQIGDQSELRRVLFALPLSPVPVNSRKMLYETLLEGFRVASDHEAALEALRQLSQYKGKHVHRRHAHLVLSTLIRGQQFELVNRMLPIVYMKTVPRAANADMYTSIIKCLSNVNDIRSVLLAVRQMTVSGIQPSDKTIEHLQSICKIYFPHGSRKNKPSFTEAVRKLSIKFGEIEMKNGRLPYDERHHVKQLQPIFEEHNKSQAQHKSPSIESSTIMGINSDVPENNVNSTRSTDHTTTLVSGRSIRNRTIGYGNKSDSNGIDRSTVMEDITVCKIAASDDSDRTLSTEERVVIDESTVEDERNIDTITLADDIIEIDPEVRTSDVGLGDEHSISAQKVQLAQPENLTPGAIQSEDYAKMLAMLESLTNDVTALRDHICHLENTLDNFRVMATRSMPLNLATKNLEFNERGSGDQSE
eukprot:CFRG1903T1